MLKELYIEPFSFTPINKDNEIDNMICDYFNNEIKGIFFGNMLGKSVEFITYIGSRNIYYGTKKALSTVGSSYMHQYFLKNQNGRNVNDLMLSNLRDILKFDIEVIW